MIDDKSLIGNECKIQQDTDITDSVLDDEVVVAKGSEVRSSTLGKKVMLGNNNTIVYSSIGKYCYTGFNTTIRNAILGKFNSISWNVSIGGNTHDLNHITTHSFLVYEKWGMGAHGNWKSEGRECKIENDVWIAAGAHILRGVTVHNGAVIGAGAVVTKDVPPYAIVAGNPAKIIRMRCEPAIIERLQELEWWNISEDIIREHLDLFQAELSMDVINQIFRLK